ncbi:MAG: PfkB family carbohydrate kinase, partial [Herbiconiux sp.]|nr:PfkB family carbohydrate kinase [Herbiconiux sp.]
MPPTSPTPLTSVVAIGESLLDVVVRPGLDPLEHPGGSPMNIAIGLARLGRPVTLVTEVGTDARGAAIVEHLRADGVQLAAGSVRHEATSTATAHLGADGSAEYVFDLRWSLPSGLTAADPALTAAGIVHAGSIGAFLEPGGRAVASLLAELAGAEHPPLVPLDPNIRASIVPDHGAALGR